MFNVEKMNKKDIDEMMHKEITSTDKIKETLKTICVIFRSTMVVYAECAQWLPRPKKAKSFILNVKNSS
jgi:hypothetical protein